MALVRRVVAPNPGPYTGPGTNTWIVGERPAVVVIDPGPDEDSHLKALQQRIGATPLAAILVTHSHTDHLPLAERLAAQHPGVSVARFPDLADGDLVRAGGVTLQALHTPGHAPDHLAFWLADDRVLFTGDLVLGQGSSMVTYPEGDVAAYLRSLERIAQLQPRLLFPGHWDPIEDAPAKIEEYRRHRLEREAQILAELERGPGSAAELTNRVYSAELAGRPEPLLRAAELTLRAHLRKLIDEGRVVERAEVFSAATG